MSLNCHKFVVNTPIHIHLVLFYFISPPHFLLSMVVDTKGGRCVCNEQFIEISNFNFLVAILGCMMILEEVCDANIQPTCENRIQSS